MNHDSSRMWGRPQNPCTQPFLPVRAFFAFFVFAVFAQPVTWMGVFWCISSPFWAVNAVGITSGLAVVCLTLRVTVFLWPLLLMVTFFLTSTVFVTAHRLPLAARAEYLPSGSVSSKLPIGWSGTAANVLLVMPALLMNVSPCRSIVTP